MERNRSVLTVSDAWKATYPGGAVGVLAMAGVVNPQQHEELDLQKDRLESELRARLSGYDRAALKSLPVLRAYDEYYKRFGKSYHVLLQLESVVLKGRSIPHVAALVEAMFMSELKNQLLTAGHDLNVLEMPVGIDVADGSERYTRMDGQDQRLKPGDMHISDARGVISSVIYGPDRRTAITLDTQRVLFTVYAPPGIDEERVRRHLQDIRTNVLIVSPNAQVEALEVRTAR